jgi:hypothetical protein
LSPKRPPQKPRIHQLDHGSRFAAKNERRDIDVGVNDDVGAYNVMPARDAEAEPERLETVAAEASQEGDDKE